MIDFNRRHILTGAVATAAASTLPPFAATPGHAAAPVAGKQAPSFYRLKLGDFEITVVNDGARAIPLPATFVRNVSNEQVLAAAEAAYMPKGSIVAPFNPIVVNTGAKLVLIDTGYGPGLGSDGRPAARHLGRCRFRSQGDRHGPDLAHAWRPYPRTEDPRWRACLPECRNQGAGRRLGILDERRQHEQGPGGLPEGLVRIQSQDFLQSRGQGDALRVGSRRSLRASPRSNPAAIRPVTRLSSSHPDRKGCSSKATSPMSRSCFCAIPIGRSCSTTSRRKPCRPADASTTWSQPRKYWSPDTTSRSPGSATSRRPEPAIGLVPAAWSPVL